MKVIIYADGGSRGNPGIAGSGTVVYSADRSTILKEIVYVAGTSTSNNVAEYNGLLRGLEAATELGATDVEFHMDSKLVVEQINGRWKIKHPDMQQLALAARKLIKGFNNFSLAWVPRAKNKAADKLSNDAMDAAAAGHPVGIVGAQAEAPPSAAQEGAGDVAPADEVTSAQADTATTAQPGDWRADRGPVTRFILLRHGQTPMSAARQYSGRANPALSELGEKQALAAAQALADVELDAIVASPLQRCQQTARAVAQGRDLDIETVEDLIEVDFGQWEGKTFAQASAADPELHARWMEDTGVACPGGESLQAVHLRVRRARIALCERFAGKTVLVVSHVNPIKSFVRQGLDAGPPVFHRLFLDLASISRVEFWDGGAVVRGVNDVGHMAGLR